MTKSWISAMKRFGKIMTWGEPLIMISSPVSAPWAARIVAKYSGIFASGVPAQPMGTPRRRNSGLRSFSECPPPRARVTAVDLSL